MSSIISSHQTKKVSVYSGYRIKLIVVIEDNGTFKDKSEYVVPTIYQNLKEAQFHILMDIEYRLGNTMFFRSQKKGFDLVRYARETSLNTYLSYRVLPVKGT